MPVVQCKCGNTTNSAVSDYWEQYSRGRKQASECYAALVGGKWERGCAFQKASLFNKRFALQVILRSANDSHS